MKEESYTGLPLNLSFKIFPDFSLTFDHFSDLIDDLLAPLTAILIHPEFKHCEILMLFKIYLLK